MVQRHLILRSADAQDLESRRVIGPLRNGRRTVSASIFHPKVTLHPLSPTLKSGENDDDFSDGYDIPEYPESRWTLQFLTLSPLHAHPMWAL